jgi:hypothetical protein
MGTDSERTWTKTKALTSSPLISRDAFDIEGDVSHASMKPLSNAIVEVLALF